MPGTPDDPAEFDAYARQYAELIRDPIREKFATESRFFAERKLQVIDAFFRRRGVDTHRLHWLDVGCGLGDLLKLGRPRFASVSGCDPSREMLQACSDLKPRHQTTIDQLPFDSAAFDFVTAVCVYHHVAEDQRLSLTREIFRVLKPGGVAAIIEHNPWNPATRLIVSRTPVDANAKLLTAPEVRRLARGANARIAATRYFLYLPEQIYKRLGFIENGLSGLPFGGQYVVFAEKGTGQKL